MSLTLFDSQIADWFAARVGEPTEIQQRAWPRIAAGEHLLVIAPTGSGKTLAAFLWSLNQLLTGRWGDPGVQVLYISPLRALNNDVQRNLLGPLAELEAAFEAAGERVRKIRVLTRSGDTPSTVRQRMVRQPPEILITTPESLNILLTSKGGRSMLGGIRCVILDEIHATAGGKRGTHLITAVERLTLLAGEFQRIALSATVRPEQEVARFVGGRRLEVASGETGPLYHRRPVAVVSSSQTKHYRLEVVSRLLSEDSGTGAAGASRSVWEPLVEDLRARIRGNHSTLLFANSRRVTEKVTRLINQDLPTDLAYSHHGSLSREIRAVVEERLKDGRLAAIVSTSSLELGIDIGALDEVILLRTPPSIAATVQRLGRAGHGVGEVSHGCFYPLFERDLLEAVVVRQAVEAQDVEAIRPVTAPLDVLAQVMVSMVAAEDWRIDDLYAFLRTVHPYRDLSRRQFDLVIEMLAGRYADSRIRELSPRITVDRVNGQLRARPGASRLIYTSGGTIPDRGYFHLRQHETRAKVGELDEEFVWERSVGDTFTLGAQSWQISGITHNDVLVRPASHSSAMAPFWRAEERNRSFHLSERIGRFLENAEHLLGSASGRDSLRKQLLAQGVTEKASDDLLRFLEAQRSASGQPLPHRRHLLIERSTARQGERGERPVILHTLWGGQVNRPLALALAAVWQHERGESIEIEQDNDSLMLLLPQDADPMRLLRQIHPDNVERLLREHLEQSGFFGARFRENAGRALLLPRGDFHRRVPLWFNRQRSKKLLTAVRRYGDFPVLVETWRTCLMDEFDLDNLARVLTEIESGEIGWSECATESATPFAADVLWKQTNRLMYENDQPEAATGGAVRQDLLRELALGSQLRPRLPAAIIDDLEHKLQRTWPGYAPQSSEELGEWVRERVLLPLAEWQRLVAAVGRDCAESGVDAERVVDGVASELVAGGFVAGAEPTHLVHIEQLGRVERLLGFVAGEDVAAPRFAETEVEPELDPLEELVAEWIRFYGPLRKSLLSDHLGLEESKLEEIVESLASDERIVIDQFRQGLGPENELEICDIENLERLLRLLRAQARPVFEARPITELPLFLARLQGLTDAGGEAPDLMTVLERLFAYPAAVRAWESEILPARLDPYYLSWLDGLFHDTDLIWLGSGKERVCLMLRSDLDLVESPPLDDAEHAMLEAIFPAEPGRFSFSELARRSGLSSTELGERLWRLAWNGRVSSTTFQTLRQGSTTRFRPPEPARNQAADPMPGRRRSLLQRGRFDRWRTGRTEVGDWYRVRDGSEARSEGLDALDREELNKDRVRLMLERYGLLFRELLMRERPEFQWGRLFRTLRLMELSGEVLSGQFFSGIPGLQFMSPVAFRDLRRGLPEDVVFWMSAADPASVCGLGLEAFKGLLPARRATNTLVFHGSRRVVVAQRSGAELVIEVPPPHPDLPRYLEFLKHWLTREFAPRRSITLERINGEPAHLSPFVEVLEQHFEVSREPAGVRLRRRIAYGGDDPPTG